MKSLALAIVDKIPGQNSLDMVRVAGEERPYAAPGIAFHAVRTCWCCVIKEGIEKFEQPVVILGFGGLDGDFDG